MEHVSRPLLALLLGTVVFFALWLIALKPGGSSGGGNSPNKPLGQYQTDINAAHRAVNTANAASGRAGADPTAAPAPARAAAATAPVPAVKAPAAAKPATHPKTTGAGSHAAVTRLSSVQSALQQHKVLALLFYNPAGPDDQAVRQELGAVPTRGGRVFKLAIPLNEIERYVAITDRVPVNFSPTLVLIGPNGQADEIVGYADPFEISQRVGDALATPR